MRTISNKQKIIYIFRVHNQDEERKILKLIQVRKFGISYLFDEFIEYKNVEEFMSDTIIRERIAVSNFDYMIRVYFNTTHNRTKFKKEVKRIIGMYYCGNDNCNHYYECIYSMYKCSKDCRIEYIWRCIKNDEERLSIKEG